MILKNIQKSSPTLGKWYPKGGLDLPFESLGGLYLPFGLLWVPCDLIVPPGSIFGRWRTSFEVHFEPKIYEILCGFSTSFGNAFWKRCCNGFGFDLDDLLVPKP